MPTRNEITSYPIAMIDFFGKKEGQTTQGFMEELRALTEMDKAEFRQLLREIGYKLPVTP